MHVFPPVSPYLVLGPLCPLTHVLQLWCHGLGAQGDGRRSQSFGLLRCCQEEAAKCRHKCLALLHKQSPVTNDNHFATGFHSDANRHRLNHHVVNTRWKVKLWSWEKPYLSSEQCPPALGSGQPWQLWPLSCYHPVESCWPPGGGQPSPHSGHSPNKHKQFFFTLIFFVEPVCGENVWSFFDESHCDTCDWKWEPAVGTTRGWWHY